MPSKNNALKRAPKNLLLNMKILLFIDEDRIDSFFSLIKGKYYKLIKNFLIILKTDNGIIQVF